MENFHLKPSRDTYTYSEQTYAGFKNLSAIPLLMTLSAVRVDPLLPSARPAPPPPSSSSVPNECQRGTPNYPTPPTPTTQPHTHTHLHKQQDRRHHCRDGYHQVEFRPLISDPCYLRPVSHVDSSGQVYLPIK